jgi:hypothetical protein
VVAIPDLLARLLKCPVDLLHDKLCPCMHFNHSETAAEPLTDSDCRGAERGGLSAGR